MPAHADIDVRMKTYYEQIPKTRLMRRTPVAIRIDGKAFHTFSKGFNEPFDQCLMTAMQETMKYLCESIQGCVFGYIQSDEISLILVDYQTFRTAAWFDYEVQKSALLGPPWLQCSSIDHLQHRLKNSEVCMNLQMIGHQI